MSSWDALRIELDASAEAGAPVAFWWRDDDAVAVVVLTGTGTAFSAGLDRKEIAKGLEGKSEFPVELMVDYPKPTIAAINGYCGGGGCELALACHLRLASDNARFGLPEVGLGIMPGYGGTVRLARLVGLGRAIEMILTGEMIDASRAAEIGLASAVVPRAELVDVALEIRVVGHPERRTDEGVTELKRLALVALAEETQADCDPLTAERALVAALSKGMRTCGALLWRRNECAFSSQSKSDILGS